MNAPPDEGEQGPAQRISNLPPRNPHFTGRAELLSRLGDMLYQGPVAVVAVHGLGGIGKTQLAQEYACAHHNKYAITWWVRASSQVELTADLVRLAQALDLDTRTNQDHVIDALHSELATRSDWLLVLDNVNDVETIRRFLPAGNGHVLITSRMRGWTGVAQTCTLEELTPDEAAEYLRASTGHDVPELHELGDELGYLPLALAQAAGYITVHNCSVLRYLQLYRSAAQHILEKGPPPHGYPETVATTWLLNVKSLTSAAIELLRLASFLAPDAIPIGVLLDSASVTSLPETLCNAAHDPVTREATIGELVSISLLARLDDHTVRVHRLVQEITRLGLNKRDNATWTRRAVEVVRGALPGNPELSENWDNLSLLAPHAQVAGMRVMPQQKAAPAAVQVLLELGLYLAEQEQNETARRSLEHALKLVRFTDTPARLAESNILLALGKVFLSTREWDSSTESALQALKIREAALGRTHPLLIPALLGIAYGYNGAGNQREAYRYFDQVAEICSSGVSIPADTASGVFMALGEGMRMTGHYAEAQNNLDQALAITRKLHGPDSFNVAKVQVCLAWLYHSRGDHAAADVEISRAIEIISHYFDAEHAFTRRLANRRAHWRENFPDDGGIDQFPV